jgi:hypothetical protein
MSSSLDFGGAYCGREALENASMGARSTCCFAIVVASRCNPQCGLVPRVAASLA